MKLSFTYHAQSQALARDITESMVAGVIRKPDSTGVGEGGATLYRRKFEDGILEVVCKKGRHKNEYLILTMYYL